MIVRSLELFAVSFCERDVNVATTMENRSVQINIPIK
jgi:hypothetical protein